MAAAIVRFSALLMTTLAKVELGAHHGKGGVESGNQILPASSVRGKCGKYVVTIIMCMCNPSNHCRRRGWRAWPSEFVGRSWPTYDAMEGSRFTLLEVREFGYGVE